MEALKFSLGYTPIHPALNNSSNLRHAKSEFLQWYTSRNISSLLEYYKNVTVDIETVYTDEEFHHAPSAMLLRDKNATQVGVSYVHYQMCYIYELDGIHHRFSSTSSMVLKLAATSQVFDAFGPPGLWLHFMSDLDAIYNPLPTIFITPSSRSAILITESNFVSMSKPSAVCIKNSSESYSEHTCAARCQNRLYKERVHRQIFQCSLVSDALSPLEAHNGMEPDLNDTMTMQQFTDSKEGHDIHAGCYAECPPPCEKAVYQLNVQWHQTLSDSYIESQAIGNATDPKPSDISYFELYFEHNARHIGVLTFVEVPTYTMPDLISSIGGSLGLFVGATLMTFLQLFSFLVEYAWVRLWKVRRKRVCLVTAKPGDI